jgi:hypothetical protein
VLNESGAAAQGTDALLGSNIGWRGDFDFDAQVWPEGFVRPVDGQVRVAQEASAGGSRRGFRPRYSVLLCTSSQ